jgi:hypothetical protein
MQPLHPLVITSLQKDLLLLIDLTSMAYTGFPLNHSALEFISSVHRGGFRMGFQGGA